ncbi:hypothetical protein Y1Q_0014649 [Alligator mississippiensis]|uniref:Uncharacterized protein n=1 Tax=Alligator mississippiensis TaxID=8496 RepID=A0A151P826_ALLMI|nr:hypothetical protein Y1Q_0014649 [Alligator mississippiensis]
MCCSPPSIQGFPGSLDLQKHRILCRRSDVDGTSWKSRWRRNLCCCIREIFSRPPYTPSSTGSLSVAGDSVTDGKVVVASAFLSSILDFQKDVGFWR